VSHPAIFTSNVHYVSASLLDDALLKCVVTQVNLVFSQYFKTLKIREDCCDTFEVWWNL